MKNNRNRKAVVLLSGGMDSATALYIAKKRGFRPTALIFDYGQRHRREVRAAVNIAKRAGCPYEILKLKFPRKGSSLLNRKDRLPQAASSRKAIPSTYVPARNVIFLSIAASMAQSEKANAVFIGAHTQDYSGYPDCRENFFESFRKTMETGVKDGKKIKILTPLIKKSKKDIIKIGQRLGVPFELTWSCYEGGHFPCGVCDSCFFRARAFRELNIEDPYSAYQRRKK